ncbi:MAG: hypothetical protein IK094_10075 [Treponema sp.]|nr:hypothetical protein [Treponema sp.]
MANYYCEYCGHRASSVQALTSNKCPKHPDGQFKGCHKLYEGREKEKYMCKYCGKEYNNLESLTNNLCSRNPSDARIKYHAPAL